jgi:hypothetical protein
MIIALGIFPLYFYTSKYEWKGAAFSISIVDIIFIINLIYAMEMRVLSIHHITMGTFFFLIIAYVIIAWKRIIQAMFEFINEIELNKKLTPICAKCKSIRDPTDNWTRIETFLKKMGCENLTHGYCPSCYEDVIKDTNF